jgi:hypothetical protein
MAWIGVDDEYQLDQVTDEALVDLEKRYEALGDEIRALLKSVTDKRPDWMDWQISRMTADGGPLGPDDLRLLRLCITAWVFDEIDSFLNSDVNGSFVNHHDDDGDDIKKVFPFGDGALWLKLLDAFVDSSAEATALLSSFYRQRPRPQQEDSKP